MANQQKISRDFYVSLLIFIFLLKTTEFSNLIFLSQFIGMEQLALLEVLPRVPVQSSDSFFPGNLSFEKSK